MTNKQLAVIVLTIFVAVLLAYQLFVGFDFRTSDQKRADTLENELDAQQNQLEKDMRNTDDALANAGF